MISVTTDIYMLLMYLNEKLSEFHLSFWPYKCQQLHQII